MACQVVGLILRGRRAPRARALYNFKLSHGIAYLPVAQQPSFSQLSRVILPEPTSVDPRSGDLDDCIAGLSPGPGVYAIRMQAAPPHLSACAYLRGRVRRLLADSAVASKQRLRKQVDRIECWASSSRLETWLLLLGLAQQWFPRDYDRRLRLRRPWFVALPPDPLPRLTVLNRLPQQLDSVYGPFPARDVAAAYAEAAGGLFQIRKCADPLLPSPDHPGCIYGEMNQCLQPCKCAVSNEEYASEVMRVDEFLRTNGGATRTSLLLARERASEELDFELAAHVHKRLERLSTATALREAPAGNLRGYGGVAITRAPRIDMVRLWPMRDATWLAPLDVPLQTDSGESRSLDARIREMLNGGSDASEYEGVDRSAHLAILLRWYRSSYRDGEWVEDVPGKGISYRKVVGAISRVMKD